MRFAAIILSLALAVCATAQADEAEPDGLGIEIGRWSYMLTQVEEHTKGDDPSVIVSSIGQRIIMARQLRETVWNYNLLRSKWCASGALTDASCGRAFTPRWLSENPNAAPPTYQELARRSTAVGDVVMPFWDKVCADARSRVADEEEKRMVCPME